MRIKNRWNASDGAETDWIWCVGIFAPAALMFCASTPILSSRTSSLSSDVILGTSLIFSKARATFALMHSKSLRWMAEAVDRRAR